jgi:hypothetical protein
MSDTIEGDAKLDSEICKGMVILSFTYPFLVGINMEDRSLTRRIHNYSIFRIFENQSWASNFGSAE